MKTETPNMIAAPESIDAEHADKFRDWIATRGGVLCWHNLEIGGGHSPYVYTPAKTDAIDTAVPGWRFGDPQLLDPATVQVRTFKAVRSFNGRLKKQWWGMWVSDATEKKAKRLADEIGGTWHWEYHANPGIADVIIGTETLAPLLT